MSDKLREEYRKETGIVFLTVTGAHTKKYVLWLENKLEATRKDGLTSKTIIG